MKVKVAPYAGSVKAVVSKVLRAGSPTEFPPERRRTRDYRVEYLNTFRGQSFFQYRGCSKGGIEIAELCSTVGYRWKKQL